MHKYRRILLIILIISGSMFLLFKLFQKSIVPDSKTSSKISSIPQEKKILDFYIWDDETSYVQPVVKAYTAYHSDVKINLHILDDEFYDDIIKELLAGETKIDLLGVRGISLLVQMKTQGQLLDLTPYIINNNMDVTAYGNMFNDLSIDGDYYGLPTRSTCWFLLYNKDLFDESGTVYPDQMTWDEYRQLAINLTKGNGKDKVYGGFWPAWVLNFGGIQRSSYLIDDDLTYTKESLEMLNNFYNVDKSHISYKQMVITEDEIDYLSIFEDGKIAMMPQGEWMINMLIEYQKENNSGVNWDIAPMPIFNDQDPSITWGQYQFASIVNDTEYPEECIKFVQFLCGEEGARIYAEKGIIHAYSNDEIKQIYMNAVGKESASIFYESKKVQEELAVPNYQEVYAAFKVIARDYLLGKKTIDQAMIQFTKERSEIYNNQ